MRPQHARGAGLLTGRPSPACPLTQTQLALADNEEKVKQWALEHTGELPCPSSLLPRRAASASLRLRSARPTCAAMLSVRNSTPEGETFDFDTKVQRRHDVTLGTAPLCCTARRSVSRTRYRPRPGSPSC